MDELRAILERCAERMHDYAVGGESEDGYLHDSSPWQMCTAAECEEVRAALRGAVPEAGSREGLRAAAHAYRTIHPCEDTGHRGCPADQALVAALGDTQEPRPDLSTLTRYSWPDETGVMDESPTGAWVRWDDLAAASPAAPETREPQP